MCVCGCVTVALGHSRVWVCVYVCVTVALGQSRVCVWVCYGRLRALPCVCVCVYVCVTVASPLVSSSLIVLAWVVFCLW